MPSEKPFEIRTTLIAQAQLLLSENARMAFEAARFKYEKLGGDPPSWNAFTIEDVILGATELNKFVSNPK